MQMGAKKHIKLAFSPSYPFLYKVGKLEKLSLPLTSLNSLNSLLPLGACSRQDGMKKVC